MLSRRTAVPLGLLLGTAQAAPTPGAQEGTRLVRGESASAFVFAPSTAKRYRRIAGRKVVVLCATIRSGLTGASIGGDVLYAVRAPARPGRLRVPNSVVDGADFCGVYERGEDNTDLRQEVAVVPRTAAGRAYQDERRIAFRLQAVLRTAGALAGTRSSDRWPAPSEMRTRDPGLVALPDAEASPPPGRVGYFSDADRTMRIVASSAAGRRLVLGYDADVLRSNVIGYLDLG